MDMNISVVSDQQYIIHSCANLRISIRGRGSSENEETELIILAFDTVEFLHIDTTIGLKVYSDAFQTSFGTIKTPKLHVNNPGTTFHINGASFKSIDLAIIGANLTTITNTTVTNTLTHLSTVITMIYVATMHTVRIILVLLPPATHMRYWSCANWLSTRT